MIGQSVPAPESLPLPEPAPAPLKQAPVANEIGGRDGLDPTRYGDWEKNGRCVDF
ncbi:MAG TPA: DUF1674 domain-containing protein [Luteimonas sp.]|nr:DUF1674 domain-containing protein [Luteimonas sp.]